MPVSTTESQHALSFRSYCPRAPEQSKENRKLDEFLWLNQTGWSAISAIASAATFFGGLVAVLVAFKQIQSARQLHGDQVRPYIIVDIEPNPASWMLHDLIIRNIGQTAAVDCRIQLDPKPKRASDTEKDTLGDAKVLNEPIAMLAPGREIRLFFDSMIERMRTNLPMLYAATVSYQSHATGEQWTETYTLDVATLKGTENIDIYSIHHAAKALREIQKDLRKSNLIKGTVEAVTENRTDRIERLKAEREERVRQFREHKKAAQENKDSERDATT